MCAETCSLQDPSAYTPGELELQLGSHPGLYQGQPGPYKMHRDRNMRVPWAGIDTVLTEIAAAWGDPAAFEDARRAGRQRWVATAEGIHIYDGPLPPVHKRLDDLVIHDSDD